MCFVLGFASLTMAQADVNAKAIQAYEAGNEEDAIKIFTSLASKGNPVAAYNLGYILKGKNPYTASEAESLVKFAAEKGIHEAMHMHGEMILRSENPSPAQKRDAISWIKKAAELGNPYAQADLGSAYYKGDGILQDYQMAERYIKLAIENGHIESLYSLDSGVKSTQKPLTHVSNNMIKEVASRVISKKTKDTLPSPEKQIANEIERTLMARDLMQLELVGRLFKSATSSRELINAYMWFIIVQSSGRTMFDADTAAAENTKMKLSRRQILEAQTLAKRCIESEFEFCP